VLIHRGVSSGRKRKRYKKASDVFPFKKGRKGTLCQAKGGIPWGLGPRLGLRKKETQRLDTAFSDLSLDISGSRGLGESSAVLTWLYQVSRLRNVFSCGFLFGVDCRALSPGREGTGYGKRQ